LLCICEIDSYAVGYVILLRWIAMGSGQDNVRINE
jgi:hypothetical protein